MLLSVSCIQMQQIGFKTPLNCFLLCCDNVCQTLLLQGIIVRNHCTWKWMAENEFLELTGGEAEVWCSQLVLLCSFCPGTFVCVKQR